MATKQLTTEEQISYFNSECSHLSTQMECVQAKIDELEGLKKFAARRIKALKKEAEALDKARGDTMKKLSQLGAYDGFFERLESQKKDVALS